MRIVWLLLFFPSFAFAVMGCPVGVQLGNVTMATRLPACVKFDGSDLGGCSVDCKEICVELPLANTKGPVETTGGACKLSDNGSGDGDSDGSGKTPGEGSSGTKPIDGWFDFQPVVGDATGTSVSGAVAKLNKNLGLAFRQLMDGTKRDSNNINSITHSAESFSRDMKTSLYHLDRMSNDVFQIKNNSAETLGRLNTSNDFLQSINSKILSLVPAASGAGSTGGEPSSSSPELLAIRGDVATLRGMTQSMLSTIGSMSGNTSSMDSNLRSIPSKIDSIDSTLKSVQSSNSSQLGDMQGSLSAIKSMTQQALQSGWGGSGGGDGSGSFDIDYSKMPGDSSNPLSVAPASYESKTCEGGANCFFDVATVQTKLDEANNSLMSNYKAIGEEVKQIFSFNFYGSAEPLKCLDLFTLYGKEYSVCPPSGDFWSTLASLLMFIFYFVALMVIFKR